MRQFLRLFCLVLAVKPGTLSAELKFNMPVGVTDTSQSVFSLHMTIFYICLVIAIIVFGIMLWSIIHHRKSKGAKAAQFHGSVVVEVIWTIIPLTILVAMAVPATKTLIDMYDAGDSDIDIQVTGYQWRWHYRYIGEDVDFFSVLSTPQAQIDNIEDKNPNYLLEVDKPLVLPVDKKIRFLFTSNDVIHAWWVPKLAVKKDAIPGFINESWTRINEPGIYRGQCAELCGIYHGFMPVVVEAVSQEEYEDWLEDQRELKQAALAALEQDWGMDELMAKGATVYQNNCAMCHQADGSGMPPHFPPLKGSAIATGDMQGHLDMVIKGRQSTGMPAFGPMLDIAELAAVITYERNSWGNDTGDFVTPAEVQAYMDGE